MKQTVLVCCGTGCRANGSLDVLDALKKAAVQFKSDIEVSPLIKSTGCNGFCENGPIVKIMPRDISYYKVKPGDAVEIIRDTVLEDKVIDRLLYKGDDGRRVRSQHENPFYAPQKKRVLHNIGEVDPNNIDDYLKRGGYKALEKALTMDSNAIISEVESSGLRGRGGAGFPTGTKWRQALKYDSPDKYVVCNGDEGDPGAFMDRSILEGDPHSVIEGMIICALAIGAKEGHMYIRDEYGLAVENTHIALQQARERGFLGNAIMGSGVTFDIDIVRGGGAFVCGESTALMASVEGRVGEPRAKYIRSVQRGLWNKPTVLNNVETLANIPNIIINGGEKFKDIGTEKSSGTKVFALVGKVKRTGLVEIPMGSTLKHLIYDIGGGITGDRPFKAVQTGGPSGGCIPASMLDLPMDFDTLVQYGAMMGSGGVIVMDDRSCMVEVARYYIHFLCEESCGKCTPCREGLRHLLQILTDICEGRGQDGDIELMETICHTMQDASLCSLGKSAANPVLTTIKYFRNEYEAHINQKKCPAGVCPKLTSFEIDEEACRGCTRCSKACPAGAITGVAKKPHTIDQKKCIACGSCREVCKFDAVITKGKGNFDGNNH
ncbi:MAG: NADH-quinone oxidoreductase subunit NuoF [Eubacterium sp.]